MESEPIRPPATLVDPARARRAEQAPSTSAAARRVSRGVLLGRYVILSVLGAGAMGVVVAAYDPELDRKVALKLIETRVGDRDRARARLKREAQALAKLAHPNVVGVHDVGVHDGQLFVGMEFVEGQTLGAWMAQVEHPRPWPEVLRVFVEAGKGLAAAHAAGLIHRDFKPDNVMLGDDGRVRVMDFGLARAGEDDDTIDGGVETSLDALADERMLDSPLTRTGAVLGTPAYMSPEQFAGVVADARSDQFGFCVSLYEALYGVRPFAGSTMAELFRATVRGQIEPAPKRASVPAWLRKVVVRGLAPRPGDRWPSMQALLEALANNPAIRRRRWGLGLAAVGLVAGGFAGLTWLAPRDDAQTCAGSERQLVGVWDEARRSDLQAVFAGTGLSYAPQTWTRVERRLDDYAAQWILAWREACEATRSGAQSGALLDLRMACLDERLGHVQAIVDVLAEADASVVAKAVDAVANLPSLDRCADTNALLAAIPPPDDPQVAEQVAALDQRLINAEALENAGKYAGGLALAAGVVTDARGLDYEPLQVRAWLREAALRVELGDYEAARASYERAYDSAVGLNMIPEAALASSALVYVVGAKLARHAEGRSWARHARPLVRAADVPRIEAIYLHDLGVVARAEGEYEEAREHHERALALFEDSLGPKHERVAITLNSLGIIARSQGNYADARAYYERALAIDEEVLGPDHPRVASTLSNLGVTAGMQGEFAEARGYHERALATFEATLGPGHAKVASSLNNLGSTAFRADDFAEARAYFERALAINVEVFGPEHLKVALTLGNLGAVALEEREYEEALEHEQRALAMREQALEPDNPRLAYPLAGVGDAPLGLGRAAEALPYLERALKLRSDHAGDPLELAEVQLLLARALWELGDADERARARALAQLAEAAYARGGDEGADGLAEVRAWQEGVRARAQ